ncbi:MAG: hypothetical protein JF588_17390 [Caulobacterales bacterium]|nr:hypothetical protein [Caulobacterales bacterium]
MKTLILSLAAAASLTAGGAAVAQRGAGEIERRIDYLQHQIDRGTGDGSLNRREGWRARAALRDVSDMERRYLRDGYLTGDERADLNRRLDMVVHQVRFDRRDGDNPYEGRRYGYNTYRR